MLILLFSIVRNEISVSSVKSQVIVFVFVFVIVFVIVFVFGIVFLLVRSWLLITRIKCLKGHKSLELLFEGVL